MPFAHINGTALHYRTDGQGPPIVFIHPPLLTSEVFHYQREQLTAKFQVITFDIRGHGHSKSSERIFNYALIVEDIRQLLDYLGIEKAYLCGYSTGGAVVLEALLTYPKRFMGGIVVSGMSEFSDSWNRGLLWVASRLTGTPMLARLLTKAIATGNADKGDTFRNLYESALLDAPANVRQYFSYASKYCCTPRLSAIQQPMLLVYGQKDARFVRYAELLHDKLPHSSLYFIKDGQHQIPTKHAPKMNDLIDLWIESLSQADSAAKRPQLDLEIARKLNPAMYDQAAESSNHVSP